MRLLTGLNEIDEKVSFKSSELICILSQREDWGRSFAMSMILNNKDLKGCYVSLSKHCEFIENLLAVLQPESKDKEIIEDCIRFVELPSEIQLLEKLSELSNEFDYFIIDSVSYIKPYNHKVFEKSSKTQRILRVLKVVTQLMEKNIILLGDFDIRDGEIAQKGLSYVVNREKYIDYIFTLKRSGVEYELDFEGGMYTAPDIMMGDEHVVLESINRKSICSDVRLDLKFDAGVRRFNL